MSKELVKSLRQSAASIRNDATPSQVGPSPELVEEAADLIERQSAEIDRLRKLDAEYGTVEAAIIMADPRFDGDSDHPSCGASLIASVNRMGQVYQRSLSNKGKGDE